MLYEAWRYEVWGNAQDGYDVNDRRKVESEVEIPDNIEDSALKKLFRKTFSIAAPEKQIEITINEIGYTSFSVSGKPVGEFVSSENF